MATINEMINKYANRILNSNDKYEETQNVLKEIDKLTYTDTGNEINKEDKLKILKGIQNQINPNGRDIILKEAENKSFLELVSHMIALLENK